MDDQLRLLCVFAHPDDESLGSGSTLAKYAAEGVETHLVVATRGEHGWFGIPETNPGPAAMGALRTEELRAAAQVLGLQTVEFLGYIDGQFDDADPQTVVAQLVGHIRRVRPHVVVTFDPLGNYGHPDHIAICQLTTSAVVAAVDASYAPANGAPHSVAKLYYMIDTQADIAVFKSMGVDIAMDVDGVTRRTAGWDDWAATTRIDGTQHWETAWRAIQCHVSQLPAYGDLHALSAELHQRLWGLRSYYRAYSLVNGGRAHEDDLFAGLR